MTLGSKPLTREPGQFYARCNLDRVVKVHLATPADKDEAKHLGLEKHLVDRNPRGKPIWEWRFPHAEGAFEFHDQASYLAHMAEYHRGGSKLTGPWMGSRWTGPRLKPEGQPLCKAAIEQLRSCPDCGLIAETDATQASTLWWDEHLRGCALVSAAVAS